MIELIRGYQINKYEDTYYCNASWAVDKNNPAVQSDGFYTHDYYTNGGEEECVRHEVGFSFKITKQGKISVISGWGIGCEDVEFSKRDGQEVCRATIDYYAWGMNLLEKIEKRIATGTLELS